jgi:hypothetical protein
MESGLVIGFVEHLQVVTASNYDDIANLQTLHFTRAHNKTSQSVFLTSRCLVMDMNNELCFLVQVLTLQFALWNANCLTQLTEKVETFIYIHNIHRLVESQMRQ